MFFVLYKMQSINFLKDDVLKAEYFLGITAINFDFLPFIFLAFYTPD